MLCVTRRHKHAESDATDAYNWSEDVVAAAKALYRRAQARRFLGKLTEADVGELFTFG